MIVQSVGRSVFVIVAIISTATGAGAADRTAPLAPSSTLIVASASHGLSPVAATLTLDAAVRLATTHGYDVLSAEAALRASEGDVQSAGALANPVLGASLGRAFGYDPSRCAGCSNIGWSLSAQDPSALSDLISGKHGLRVHSAETARDAVGHDHTDAIRQLVFATRTQYIQVARAEAAVELALKVSGLHPGEWGLRTSPPPVRRLAASLIPS